MHHLGDEAERAYALLPSIARRSILASVADSPDIGRQRSDFGTGELRAAHGRHGTAIVLRLRHTLRDDLRDGLQTPIAPQPMLAGQIRREWGALGVGSVAARARR